MRNWLPVEQRINPRWFERHPFTTWKSQHEARCSGTNYLVRWYRGGYHLYVECKTCLEEFDIILTTSEVIPGFARTGRGGRFRHG
jgi:hypothetical protein